MSLRPMNSAERSVAVARVLLAGWVGLLCWVEQPQAKGAPAGQVGRPVRIVSFSFSAGKPLEQVLRRIDDEGAKGSDLILLPETWRGQNDRTVEPVEGQTVGALAELAAKHRTYIVSPIDVVRDGRRFNTAVVIDRAGKVAGLYDKAFPYWAEFDHQQPVQPGRDAPVLKTDFGKLGLAICFDVNFPEVWQRLADQGAELVVWSSAYSAGAQLGAYSLLHHYYIVTSTHTGDCQVYDLTGERLLDEKREGISMSRITLDLDRGIYHQNFNIEKRDRLLKEQAGKVRQTKWMEREQWFVLQATAPGVSARALAQDYGLEELRDYISRSRRGIDAKRGGRFSDATSKLERDVAGEAGLVGYWKLRGDCRDYSGQGNNGVNHGVDLDRGVFNGLNAYVEVPAHASLKFGTNDFAWCAWIYTENKLDDVVGDVLDQYDPSLRRGITLSVYSSGSGYQGQGNDRHVCFGIDQARMSEWEDCGRPSLTSPYVSNSMLVYQGKLYAAVTDARTQTDWCHVFRYEGKQKWIDCGRVGVGRTTGVGPLIVHEGGLYAVTWTYDWTRVKSGGYDPGRLYRYAGGTEWVDCGQPSDNRTLNCGASFQGKLYVGGGPETWGVFVYEGQSQWKPSMVFPKQGARRLFPHAMCRYNGKLYTGYPCVYGFDGNEWTYAGLPGPLETTPPLQTHSLTVYAGKLCAGTWPEAKVSRYLGGESWQEFGRVGEDGTEVNALMVYNGKLYGGSIPRAEVCRYDGARQWTSLRRFYSPEGWKPGLPGRAVPREVNEWSRVTSLTIHAGKLFASIGSCTSAVVDNPADPADVLGKVFSMEAGRCVSSDDDLGPGWKHLAAVRDGGQLRLYVDGRLVATSSAFNPADYDVSTERPLRIGFGQTDYFAGRIADVRIYNRALSETRVRALVGAGRP